MLQRFMILMLVLFACSGCSSIGNAFAPVKPRTQTAVSVSTAPSETVAAAPATAVAMPAASDVAVVADDNYRLGAEDKVKISVYGEADLSGEFVVDSSGVLAAPFIGQVQVKGMTLREFERAYAAKLKEAEILLDPKVSAEVTSFRPIYVLGEVKKPGQYAFVSGMTVQKAVALAEGFTYRASESKVEITRGGKKFTVEVSPQTTVLPGDEVRIPERFF